MSEKAAQPIATGPANPAAVDSDLTVTEMVDINATTGVTVTEDPFADYTVRLCQYNFFMRPPGINSNGDDHKSERLHHFIEHELGRFDVIAFQELFDFGSSRRNELIKAAYAQGYKFSVANPQQCAAKLRIDGGLVIISRLPIVRYASLTFDRGVDSDWLAAKGVLYAKLRVGGDQHLHLFTTHLQSSYNRNYPMTDRAVQIRLKQLYAIRRFMDAELRDEPTDQLIILAGDFNVNGRSDNTADADKGVGSDEYRAALDILYGAGIHPSLVPGSRQDGNVYVSENKFLVEDLLYDHYKLHPVTFADVKTDANGDVELDPHGQPIPRETQLTDKKALGWRARLDYIFAIRRGEDPHNVAKDIASPDRTQVEPFFVSKDQQQSMPVTQLSDHYGSSTVLQFN